MAVVDRCRRNKVVVRRALLCLQHTCLIILSPLMLVAQSGTCRKTPQTESIVNKCRIKLLLQMVVGICREAALSKAVLAVGECIFRAKRHLAAKQRGCYHQLGGIERITHVII